MVDEKKTVKKKRAKSPTSTADLPKNGGNNLAYVGKALDLKPGDMRIVLALCAEIKELPKIDLNNPEEVDERINLFLQLYAKYDLKPTMAGFASCLGKTRQEISAVIHDKKLGSGRCVDKLPKESVDLIKKGHNLLEIMWESNMLHNKINPASGIFLGKNNFGYKDNVEHTFATNTDADNYSVDDIKQRYANDYQTTIDITPDSN